LFESGDPSEPVSRASLLLKVASRLESSGRVGAAVRIYRQVIDAYGETPEAMGAAQRLQSISEGNLRVGIPDTDR
jgi:hypothetical protein